MRKQGSNFTQIGWYGFVAVALLALGSCRDDPTSFSQGLTPSGNPMGALGNSMFWDSSNWDEVEWQ